MSLRHSERETLVAAYSIFDICREHWQGATCWILIFDVCCEHWQGATCWTLHSGMPAHSISGPMISNSFCNNMLTQFTWWTYEHDPCIDWGVIDPWRHTLNVCPVDAYMVRVPEIIPLHLHTTWYQCRQTRSGRNQSCWRHVFWKKRLICVVCLIAYALIKSGGFMSRSLMTRHPAMWTYVCVIELYAYVRMHDFKISRFHNCVFST